MLIGPKPDQIAPVNSRSSGGRPTASEPFTERAASACDLVHHRPRFAISLSFTQPFLPAMLHGKTLSKAHHPTGQFLGWGSARRLAHNSPKLRRYLGGIIAERMTNAAPLHTNLIATAMYNDMLILGVHLDGYLHESTHAMRSSSLSLRALTI